MTNSISMRSQYGSAFNFLAHLNPNDIASIMNSEPCKRLINQINGSHKMALQLNQETEETIHLHISYSLNTEATFCCFGNRVFHVIEISHSSLGRLGQARDSTIKNACYFALSQMIEFARDQSSNSSNLNATWNALKTIDLTHFMQSEACKHLMSELSGNYLLKFQIHQLNEGKETNLEEQTVEGKQINLTFKMKHYFEMGSSYLCCRGERFHVISISQRHDRLGKGRAQTTEEALRLAIVDMVAQANALSTSPIPKSPKLQRKQLSEDSINLDIQTPKAVNERINLQLRLSNNHSNSLKRQITEKFCESHEDVDLNWD